jgi:hypothetical protein
VTRPSQAGLARLSERLHRLAPSRGITIFCDDRLEHLNIQRLLGDNLLQPLVSPSSAFSRCISLSSIPPNFAFQR